MKITSINQGGNISFKSGYPTFGASGHLSMTTKHGDNISFTGSPWNRANHDTVSFQGRPYPHHEDDGKQCPPEGCQPIKPQTKVPPEGGILIYRHVDMLGNVLDIKG